MTPEHAFLQAIREAPEDDDLRLVFADWLEENDDPRGELVRLSVQREQMLERDPALLPLYAAISKLRQRDEALWLGPLAGSVRSWRITRGLLALEVHVREFLLILADLPENERVLRWVGELEPSGRVIYLEHLLNLGRLPLLAGLKFPPRSTDLDGVGRLFDRPPPIGLQRLSLPNCSLGPDAVRVLSESACLAGLRELDLENNGLGIEGVQELAESPRFVNLRVLNLRNNSPWMSSSAQAPPLGGPLGAAAADALARSTTLKRLRVLRLWRNHLGREGAAALAAPGVLPALADLDLSANNVGRAGMEALTASEGFKNLRSLDVAENSLTDGGLLALLRARWLPGLTSLRLARNGITDVGVRLLAKSEAVSGLRELDLSHNPIGNIGARVLAESPLLESLRCLRLSGSLMGKTDREVLEHRFGPRLRFS